MLKPDVGSRLEEWNGKRGCGIRTAVDGRNASDDWRPAVDERESERCGPSEWHTPYILIEIEAMSLDDVFCMRELG